MASSMPPGMHPIIQRRDEARRAQLHNAKVRAAKAEVSSSAPLSTKLPHVGRHQRSFASGPFHGANPKARELAGEHARRIARENDMLVRRVFCIMSGDPSSGYVAPAAHAGSDTAGDAFVAPVLDGNRRVRVEEAARIAAENCAFVAKLLKVRSHYAGAAPHSSFAPLPPQKRGDDANSASGATSDKSSEKL